MYSTSGVHKKSTDITIVFYLILCLADGIDSRRTQKCGQQLRGFACAKSKRAYGGQGSIDGRPYLQALVDVSVPSICLTMYLGAYLCVRLCACVRVFVCVFVRMCAQTYVCACAYTCRRVDILVVSLETCKNEQMQ